MFPGLWGAFRVYAPLRDTPDLFRQVTVGELGADVVWPNGADMAADTLWRLAREQAGLTMTPDAFRIWRERKAYTLETAAKALEISRRTVAYYEQGRRRSHGWWLWRCGVWRFETTGCSPEFLDIARLRQYIGMYGRRREA